MRKRLFVPYFQRLGFLTLPPSQSDIHSCATVPDFHGFPSLIIIYATKLLKIAETTATLIKNNTTKHHNSPHSWACHYKIFANFVK